MGNRLGAVVGLSFDVSAYTVGVCKRGRWGPATVGDKENRAESWPPEV